MRRPSRRRARFGEPDERSATAIWESSYSLGEECAAILAGTYRSWCEEQALPLRPWVYLNRVAHASSADLERCREEPGPETNLPRTWDDVQQLVEEIVRTTVRPVDLPDLQRDVLVPLELSLFESDMSPRAALARAVHEIL